MYPRIWWAGFYPPRADMVMAIQSIKAEGLKTAALTNNWKHANGRALPAELDPVMKLFDVVVESAKVGMRKRTRRSTSSFSRGCVSRPPRRRSSSTTSDRTSRPPGPAASGP